MRRASLGVIEAAVLIGLPQFRKEELLAALLTFHVLYFVIPLLFATLVLGLRELHLVARRASGRRGRRDHRARNLVSRSG